MEGSHDVRVLETHRHFRLALEAEQHVGVAAFGGWQDLDGDDMTQAMGRLEDAGHPPLADQVEQLVMVEEEMRLADRQLLPLVRSDVMIFGQPAEKAIALARRRPIFHPPPLLVRRLDLRRLEQPAAA